MPTRSRPTPSADRDAALADALHSTAIHLLRRLRREDAAAGLSGPQLSALSVLVFGGPRTIGALAAAEQVRPPTMTRLVSDLAAAGLLRLQRDANDGRRVLVAATAAGARKLQAGRRRRVGRLLRQVKRLPPAERRALERAAAILGRVVAGL